MVDKKARRNSGNVTGGLIGTITRISLIALLSFMLSCEKKPPEITEIPGIALDELVDKSELTSSLQVNCTSYQGTKVKRVLVNGEEHPLDQSLNIESSGFYRLEIFLEGNNESDPEVIRIVLLDEERGEADWGLRSWTPVVPPTGTLGARTVTLVHPFQVPEGVNVPLVVLLEKDPDPEIKILEAILGDRTFLIKNETGSIQIPPSLADSPSISIDKRVIPFTFTYFEDPPQELGGTLTEDLHITAGKHVRIVSDLIIPAGITISADSGVFFSIDPEMNIYCEGNVLLNGSPRRPVTLTCTESGKFWGGFIGTGTGNRLVASNTIFSYSGFHTGGEFSYGHAYRQALVYNEHGTLNFDHCYFLDQAGQVFYPVSATIEITHSLVQRAMTSGQLNNSEVTISNTVFTDFPDDSFDYQDEDNDALYLMECDATITDCIFMFAKDDGLDSGGSGGGTVRVKDSRFAVIFHEGAALSSGGEVTKRHIFTGCTFKNCGQGLELGYSSPNHLVTVDSCLFRENGIGIRYGDNYTMSHRGMIEVSNCNSIFNESYDVWNMLRNTWSADTLQMAFDNVYVTRLDPMYPQLKLYE